MSTIVVDELSVHIPTWVTDLESFRRWARADDFPEHGWFSHLNGELWVDLSMERFALNQVKGEFANVVGPLVKAARLGHFLHDRMRLTHLEARLSTEPDGMFISFESLRAGRVSLREGADSLEVEGTADMTLEVVSPTSVPKDTVLLRDLYWKAGVQEYWLVQLGGDAWDFDILRHGLKGFSATRKSAGWVKSTLFGKSFKLTQQDNQLGYPEFTLAVR